MTVKAVLIHANGNAELIETATDLDALVAHVGGWLEQISPMVPGHGHWHGYVDEEGKLKSLPVNFTATDIATMLGWGGAVSGDVLCGPVLLLGDGRSGDEADIPQQALAAVLAYYDRHGQVEITRH